MLAPREAHTVSQTERVRLEAEGAHLGLCPSSGRAPGSSSSALRLARLKLCGWERQPRPKGCPHAFAFNPRRRVQLIEISFILDVLQN